MYVLLAASATIAELLLLSSSAEAVIRAAYTGTACIQSDSCTVAMSL
jgi:hypothetical protein